MIMCSGACGQRIKRGATFFIMRDGSRLWCQRCHMGLSTVLPPCASDGTEVGPVPQQLCYKRDLLKRNFDEDIAEPWVQVRRGTPCTDLL